LERDFRHVLLGERPHSYKHKKCKYPVFHLKPPV